MEHISVTDPISPAIERVKLMLFRPFDLGKWFTIGFCAWLAGLGERRVTGNFNSNSDHHGGDAHQQFEHARTFVLENAYWILPLVIFLVVFVVALSLVFIWLNSRGKFMFLHCVALNRSEVVEPWNKYAHLANSLFRFRLVLWLIGVLITLPLMVFMALVALSMFRNDSWNFPGVMLLIGLGLGMVFVGICFLLIRKLTADFVVPIMFLRGSRCLAAWGEFYRLFAAHFGQFVLYLLFQIVIGLAVGAMVLLAIIATCCIAGCVLAIPYIGTVLFLPVIIFGRAYSLYYLAQYGPAYNVFQPVGTAPA